MSDEKDPHMDCDLCGYVGIYELKDILAVAEKDAGPQKSNATKVEKIQENSLDWIPSPSPLVKIQTMGQKVYLRQ